MSLCRIPISHDINLTITQFRCRFGTLASYSGGFDPMQAK